MESWIQVLLLTDRAVHEDNLSLGLQGPVSSTSLIQSSEA